MAYNEKLANRVRKALSHLPSVEEQKMFRGLTFMVNDKTCVSVSNDELMMRMDPEIHETAVKRKGARAMVMKGREYRGYVYVNEQGLEMKKDFSYWIDLALDFNKRAKSSKRKK